GLCTARSHRGERLVTGRVDEGDDSTVARGLVRADVLRDATGLAGDDVRGADVVKQRGLAVVDVPHHRDDRRARFEERVVVLVLAEERLQLELLLLPGL